MDPTPVTVTPPDCEQHLLSRACRDPDEIRGRPVACAQRERGGYRLIKARLADCLNEQDRAGPHGPARPGFHFACRTA